METEKGRGKSPWRTIWFRPKETIRKITEKNPNHRLGVLCVLYGLVALLGLAQTYSLGEKYSLTSLLLIVLLLSPIWGYIVLSFFSLLVRWTGKLLGGKGIFSHIRCALAWSNAALLVNLLTWIVLILVFQERVFQQFPAGQVLNRNEIIILFPLLFLQLIGSIWGIVIYINGIAEVQGISIFKAIINILLAGLVLFILLLFLFAVIFWTCAPFFDEPMITMIF